MEATLNRALTFDARTPQRLERVHGKKLAVEMTDIKLRLLIHFSKEGLHFSQAYPPLNTAAVLAKGPSVAFLSLACSKDPFAASRLGLAIEGDMQLAENIQQFFLDLQIDWEEMLAQITGDTIAHSLFKLFKKGRQQQKIIQENFTLALGEYLKQEIRLLPSQTEVDEFLNGVDELNQAIERLQARLTWLTSSQAGDRHPQGEDQANIGEPK